MFDPTKNRRYILHFQTDLIYFSPLPADQVILILSLSFLGLNYFPWLADPILCMMRIVPYCHPVLIAIYGFELHKIIVHCTSYRYIPILCFGSKSFNSEALFLGNMLGWIGTECASERHKPGDIILAATLILDSNWQADQLYREATVVQTW